MLQGIEQMNGIQVDEWEERQQSNESPAQARLRILALAAEDDFEAAKKKYRKLMGQFHPDSGAGRLAGMYGRSM